MKPLKGQRPLFDECTRELLIYGGQVLVQGVLFGPPDEPAARPPAISEGTNDAKGERDTTRVSPGP